MVKEMSKNKVLLHMYEDGIMKHITCMLTLNLKENLSQLRGKQNTQSIESIITK